MKKVARKVPQSVKVQKKVDLAVQQAVEDKKRFYSSLITAQQNRHNHEIEALKQSIPQQQFSSGWVVPDWRNSWKWFSNIAFALIIAVQAFYDALPPELIATLPADTQSTITAIFAVLGILGRYINQKRQQDFLDKESNHV